MARGPQEVEVRRFHTEKAKASYVLALPPSHNPKKASPLILDFHGAIQPGRKGANVTYDRLWSSFVRKVPVPGSTPEPELQRKEKRKIREAREVLEAQAARAHAETDGPPPTFECREGNPDSWNQNLKNPSSST